MTRYQIKILDKDITDLVHEISTQIVSQAVVISKRQMEDMKIYPQVFTACKEVLKKYVHGFHVCGCRPHCDLEAQSTELQSQYPKQDLSKVDFRSPRISRYVLFIDVTLYKFSKELEVEILKAIATHTNIKNWHGLLFPVIKKTVEAILGKYTYYSPTCNREEYICEMGVCTEFDPWGEVTPQAKVKSR